MAVFCALKFLALVYAFAWMSSCKGFTIMDIILQKLETAGNEYISSKDIPISLSKGGVTTDKWFTYIIELASKFGNGKSTSEVLLHVRQNVKRAFNWCKPNMNPNYVLNYTNSSGIIGEDKYFRIPCGKVVFSKSTAGEQKFYVHYIKLAYLDLNEDNYARFGLNLTIHSFMSSEHNQYLTGDVKESVCEYVVLAIVHQYRSSRWTLNKQYGWCGEILGKDMIFQHEIIGIIAGSKYPKDAFQLIMYYQAINIASNIYADTPIDIYSYNSSSTFYPNLWFFDVPKIEAVLVSLVRWYIKAIIGQNIKLVISKTGKCRNDLEAISIYDGPIKVYDQLVCSVTNKSTEPIEPTEPTEPLARTGHTEPSAQIEQAELVKPLISYTSTFNSQMNYCYDIKEHSHIFFTFDVQTTASTKIHVEHDQKYQLQVASGTNTIYYRSWQFTSDSFIKLELTALRQFSGHTQECLFGGMVLNDIGNPLKLQYGSICTTYQGYEPLFSTPSWYFNQHGGVLTVYAFHNYFTIDIDLTLTSQLCEGITNICSTHCM